MALKDYSDRGEVFTPINQTIAATATVDSAAINVAAASQVKVYYKTKGATTTAKLQGSFNGTDWYDIQTLVAGINPVQDSTDPYVRITATNANATVGEANEILLYGQL